MAEKRDGNHERFRSANERLKTRLVDLAWDGRVPFVCECPDPDCLEIVELTGEEYEAVRARPNAYLLAPRHESRLDGTVGERTGRYVVVDADEAAA